MKKALLLVPFLLLTTHLSAQTYSSNRSLANIKAKKSFSNDDLSVDVHFGFTNFFNDDIIYNSLKDNINFGGDVSVTKTFDSQFYVSSGFTFSIIDDGVFDLWKNTLNYFSVNADVGYRFKYYRIIEPYAAIGGSYILTSLDELPPFSTLSKDIKTYSINLTTGTVIWLGRSNYGIVVQNIIKIVNDKNLVSHNRFVLGFKYKF